MTGEPALAIFTGISRGRGGEEGSDPVTAQYIPVLLKQGSKNRKKQEKRCLSGRFLRDVWGEG